MEKVFKMMEDHLEVVATQDDKIFLPVNGEQVEIGTYDQTTIQKINPDKVQSLKDFIETENGKAETQLKEITKQLETIGEVVELDDNLVQACSKQIGKGTKVFKQKMLVLNNHLEQIQRSKALKLQKEYIEKQYTQMQKELTDLKKAI